MYPRSNVNSTYEYSWRQFLQGTISYLLDVGIALEAVERVCYLMIHISLVSAEEVSMIIVRGRYYGTKDSRASWLPMADLLLYFMGVN